MKAAKLTIAIFVVVLGFIGYTYWSENSGCTKGAAYSAVKASVVEKLVAPATASFPSQSKFAIEKTGNCRFSVSGYVDAQNSFGALIRSKFSTQTIGSGGHSPVVLPFDLST